MGKIAIVFPGQGAQTVGMGKDVYEQTTEGKRVFDEASEALDFDLKKIIFEGPEEQLKLTYFTQPALLATSLALYEVLKPLDIPAHYMAGHSLGEYSALTAAGAISLTDAIRTVHARGTFMDSAVPAGQGSMAAVLGAERDALQQLCATITAETSLVEMANMNCPGQIVVSGTALGVQTLVTRAQEAGAKRAIPLDVSGPFHSSLMQPAAEGLADVLANITMNEPLVPIIANVTATPMTDVATIRQLLVKQVTAPVLWEDTIRYLIDEGVDLFIEVGSGSVLSGLIRKINRQLRVVSLSSLASIEAFKQEDGYVDK